MSLIYQLIDFDNIDTFDFATLTAARKAATGLQRYSIYRVVNGHAIKTVDYR